VTSGWAEALEGKARVMRHTRSATMTELLRLFYGNKDRSPGELVDRVTSLTAILQRAARAAEVFYWPEEVIAGLMGSDPEGLRGEGAEIGEHLFDGGPIDVLDVIGDGGSAIFWFGEPLYVSPDAGGGDRNFAARGLLVTLGSEAIIGLDGDIRPGRLQLGMFTLLDMKASGIETRDPLSGGLALYVHDPMPVNVTPRGVRAYFEGILDKYGDNKADEVQQGWAGMFTLLALKYLSQRVAVTPRGPRDKGERKAAAKFKVDPSVRIVYWRKAEETPREPSGEPGDRRYTCHWTVQPFTRKLRDGRVVPVRGHIRGPRDKPMKPPAARVNVVRR
jgi:hypothetical protein